MKNNRSMVLAMVMVVFISLFSFNSAFAGNESDNFLKSEALHGLAPVNDDEPFASAKDDNDMAAIATDAPSASIDTEDNAPSTVTNEVTREEGTKLYYCVLPKKQVTNLEALCNKYNAPMQVYRSFKQLLILNKVGCIVTADSNNKYFITKLRKLYHAKILKDVSIRVKIHVHSVPYMVNMKKEDFMAGDFGTCDAALQNMIKNVYGHHSSMFKGVAQTFPGLLDKVTVKAKNHWLFGKNKKVLFNPDVTIEVLALNMKGKGKNVTLFHENYNFKTIKHAANYNWNK